MMRGSLFFWLLLCALLSGCSDSLTCKGKDDGEPPSPFRATFDKPDRGWLLEPADGCGLTWSPSPEISPLVIRVFAIRKRSDSSVEALLGKEPDGAREWLMMVLGPKTQAVDEGTLSIEGLPQHYYRLLGRPPGIAGDDREILIARTTRATEHIVLVAYYYPDERAERQPIALKILENLKVQLAEP